MTATPATPPTTPPAMAPLFVEFDALGEGVGVDAVEMLETNRDFKVGSAHVDG